jgi:hypothetical protein
MLSPGVPAALGAEPLHSPTWGFYLDLPEGYQLSGGDGRDSFSFQAPGGAVFDLAIQSPGKYSSAAALGEDLARRLGNRGTGKAFEYRGKEAVFLELAFPDPRHGGGGNAPALEGWGLCLELEGKAGAGPPFLLALAYGPGKTGAGEGIQALHQSALDSLAPSAADRLNPGPLTAYRRPRGPLKPTGLARLDLRALLGEGDAEAAQSLVDREFEVLQAAARGPRWREAWIRFYRAIYRDSFERLADAAFALERHFSRNAADGRDFAGKVLQWVQTFTYERDLEGSDFVNLVDAVVEGRGDCDSRALLWAIVLERANIPAGIMVSREYGHAMGLADLPGPGARFEVRGTPWLVAETTSPVDLGLIAQSMSGRENWLGVLFDGP